jgi:hypothetical protein
VPDGVPGVVRPPPLPPPQAISANATAPKTVIAASLRLLIMNKPATGRNPTQAQSTDGRNVPSNGAIDDGATNAVVVGAVVVTVTVTFTELVPSRVTDDFERVHVVFVGAPAHANWTVPVNPSLGANVAV